MSKLSPTLKSLINAAHARPGPIPAPPQINSIFKQIEREARERHVGRPSWLALATATTMTLNSPGSLNALYTVATASSPSSAVETAEYIREAGLKCVGFNGLPRVINMLNAFHASLPSSVASQLNTRPSRVLKPELLSGVAERGKKLWDSIYRPFENKLYDKLATSHPDLPVHILNSEYGALLADPPSKSQTPATAVGRVNTSIIAVACLRAQQGVGPQVLSHVFGLRKAVEDGSWRDDAAAVEDGGEEGVRWLASDEGCVWILEKVDSLVEALGGANFAPARAKL
ncbi:uncharacterized protein BDZ99DRAFT_193176 [Mytilinidion resinicola]|uniref:Dol-P-Man:Man(5)GlcNAc(2)-PP-Dol alpha-1,3-mannosyltransferase n=1 Tax=Mytilinidion resinicola TaxID=574789 RepID=A0A6A6Z263_9PEZI|nr:uncharacterized protein BDZ99DRAFT_193176 [Mytilinidion resinicola]KAF2815262.1 hypothetical protein BDZ99DRAFT_193176 [Mytilinidion resinicola]